MKAAALLAIGLLAACGEAGNDVNQGAPANQIERLSTPKVEEADEGASARLQPISREDIDREGLLGAGCDFRRDGEMLLVAVGSDAIARIGGEIRHLVQSAPVGVSGGFFEDRQLSVSVGRTGETGTSAGETQSWPARLTVTNRRTEVQRELEGIWTCGV